MGLSNAELSAGEEVLVDVHPHWVSLAAPAVVTVVAVAVAAAVAAELPKAPAGVAWVLLVMVVVPAAWLVVRAARRSSISLVVTTQRILLQRGMLRRDVTQLRLSRVKEVHCAQTFWERVIGSGRLVLEVTDEDGAFVVDDVHHPRALQRVIGTRIGRPEVAAEGSDGRDGRDDGDDWDGHEGDDWDDQVTPPHGVPAPLQPEDAPTEHSTTPRDDPRAVSVHRQLVEIDDLRRRGILTDEEFERKKAELLSRL